MLENSLVVLIHLQDLQFLVNILIWFLAKEVLINYRSNYCIFIAIKIQTYIYECFISIRIHTI